MPVDEATPTWPGPCWATIATGTGADGHGITSNDLTGHRLADHPDFVTVATRAGVSTLLAVSGWAPLAVTALAGLIPAGAEAPRLSFVYLGAVDAAGHLLGAGPAYREAARSADQRVGRLLAALGDLSGH